jgi:acyl-CoA hydrolase
MEIGIKVVAEDIRTLVVRHVNSCFFTTDEEKRRWQAALIRKDLRRELAQRFEQSRVTASSSVRPG